MAASTDVAVPVPDDSKFPVLAGGADGALAILRENVGEGGVTPADLDRITIPAGGGTAWDVPDGDPTRVLSGVIVAWQPSRSYWVHQLGDDDGESGAPPDCSSADAKLGNGEFGPGSEGNPTGECTNCPMDRFGSGRGNSKACKEQRRIFMLTEGSILPVQVSLPPTSIQPLRKYMIRLAGRGKRFSDVVTDLSLKQVKGDNTYSVAEPRLGGELSDAQKAAARTYGATIEAQLAAYAASAAERAADGSDASHADPGTVPGGGDPWAEGK